MAGTKYPANLNMDEVSIKTPAVYDETLDEWVMHTKLSGSTLELYGATVATRPAASAVAVGTIFMAVQTQQMWQSDGTDWVVV